jgi:nucleoid-associated protein YgaU
MGQLEKYGLYVLCLVIFLILGVTLWGGGDVVQPPGRQQVASTDPARGTASPGGPTAPVNARTASAVSSFDLLLGDEPRRGGGTAPATSGTNGGANGNRGTAADASTPKPAPQPQPEPAKDAPPVPAATTVVYKVQEGDTFGSLARTKLGSEALWPEIHKLNPTIKPEKLRAGDEIRLPTAAALAAKDAAKGGKSSGRGAPLDRPLPEASDGKRFYTVKKGDNFERIAAAQLGSARRVKDLLELNRSVEPAKLQIGQRIQLPAK